MSFSQQEHPQRGHSSRGSFVSICANINYTHCVVCRAGQRQTTRWSLCHAKQAWTPQLASLNFYTPTTNHYSRRTHPLARVKYCSQETPPDHKLWFYLLFVFLLLSSHLYSSICFCQKECWLHWSVEFLRGKQEGNNTCIQKENTIQLLSDYIRNLCS